MTPRYVVCALSTLGMLAAAPASAEIGAMDPVPSATLLFPYFEAETGDDSDADTLLTIENSANDVQLAHVVVWSDRGVPVLDFDLYLVQYGVERLSMRALLSGNLPSSASGSGFPDCDFPLDDLDDDEVDDLQAALTGQHMPDVSDDDLGCPGVDHGDSLARGYVTVDTVTGCSNGDVEAGSYWSTWLDTTNTLLGSFVMLNGEDSPAYAEQAVHIEASTSDTRTDMAGDLTFYGSFVAYDASDHRERLPSMWSAEYVAGSSDVIVWRETKRDDTDPADVSCDEDDQAELDLDLTSYGLFYFDETENATQHDPELSGSPFKYATGRYLVGGDDGLPTPYREGILNTNLNFAAGNDPMDLEGLAQSVVLSLRSRDVVKDREHGTLAYATPLDDGYNVAAASMGGPATCEFGPGTDDRPRAMMDNRGAGSLVLPYFEVSLDEPNAAQTQFSIINDSATARVTKVTLFTDRGIPTESFMVYLTGYDVAILDLRLLFTGGLGARSASDGQDPQDSITPQGQWSQDINFASCTGSLPAPIFDDEKLAYLRAAHTGQEVDEWDGKCGGRDLGDDVARGFIVIDTYSHCSVGPVVGSDFTGSSVTAQDGISGSFEVWNREDGFSYGSSMIALHDVQPLLTAGDMTFYGWLDDWPVGTASRREGLPNAWRVPFMNDDDIGSTELIFFRPVHRTAEPYDCDDVPDVFDAGLEEIIAHSGDDNATDLTGFEPGFVAGRIEIGDDGLEVPYEEGSLELNLDFAGDDNQPAGNSTAHMGFVGAVHRIAGTHDSVFVQGFPLHLAGEP